MIARIAAAVRRVRLAMAESDLRWMEEIGTRNLARQRAAVAELRRRTAVDDVLLSSRDVERRAEREIKHRLIS